MLAGLAFMSLQTLWSLFGLRFMVEFDSVYFMAFSVILGVVLFVVMMWLYVNWLLVNVVVVTESKWGFQALVRSWYLVKGMRCVALKLIVFYGVLEGLFVMVYSGSLFGYGVGMGRWATLFNMMFGSYFLMLLLLYSSVANVVLYNYCKAVHRELAIDVAEGFVCDYVGLRDDGEKAPYEVIGVRLRGRIMLGASNQVADALSRMYDDEEADRAAFMALSRLVMGLLTELKSENETRYYVGKESKLKELLLREFHDTPSVGHGGIKKMLIALFYWPGMRKSVEEYIRQCLVCQQTKYSTQATGGYLQPLPTPTAVWEDVSINFITGLPVSKGMSVILVVVDRFSKYAHFGSLPTSFNAHKVAELFLEIVIKHHGIPKTIVSDCDPIFVSKFWTQLFQLSGTQLNRSTAYHPQSDGQTEVVNRGLEQYLRAMVSDRPQHNSGQNLLEAKNKIEVKANRNRREVVFNVGDKVLVKLQPYRQITLTKRLSNKLAKPFYGPYEIVERIEKVAYRLALPSTSRIHPVFHVSILKFFSGYGDSAVTELPEELQEWQPLEKPVAICDFHMVLRNGSLAQQVLVIYEARENVTPMDDGLGRGKRTKTTPGKSLIVCLTKESLRAYVWLYVNWLLVNVVVVTESKWGFQALVRSWYLLKGMRCVALKLLVFYGVLEGFFVMVYSGSLFGYGVGMGRWTALLNTMFGSYFLMLLLLYSSVANVVLYNYCKAVHGELVIDVAEGFVCDYVGLSDDGEKAPYVVMLVTA
nr:Ty3/gypsy retrotransposon protein [Tanacetum cinerariifolium]